MFNRKQYKSDPVLSDLLRIKNLDQLIAPKRVKDALSQGLKTHMLLYGLPGTGKTSAGYVLTQDYDTLFINCSENSSVENVRTTIRRHCNKMGSLDNESGFPKKKAVFLDEIDGGSNQFQIALKSFIEEYQTRGVRFIMTSNYIHKVESALKDRMVCINFNTESQEEYDLMFEHYCERVKFLLQKKSINIAIESEDILREFVKEHFPSFRGIINWIAILRHAKKKVLTREVIQQIKIGQEKLFEKLFEDTKPDENYAYLKKYEDNTDDVLKSLGEGLIKYVLKHKANYSSKIPALTIIVANYQHKHTTCPDKLVNMLACFWDLQRHLSD